MVFAVPRQYSFRNSVISSSLEAQKECIVQQQNNVAKKQKKLNVRFEEVYVDGAYRLKEQIIENPEPLTDTEKEKQWWCLSDYATFKKEGSDIEKRVRNQSSIERSCCYSNTLLRIYKSCLFRDKEESSSSTDELILEKWDTSGAQRGLERDSVPRMSLHRRQQKNLLVQRVLYTQQILKHGTLHPEKRAKLFRYLSTELSRAEQLFAVAMAKLDEVACRTVVV